MRPNSVVRFEQLYWLWLIVSIVSVIVSWTAVMHNPQMVQVLRQMPWFPYAILGVMVALLVWLGVAIARRASNVGRWIFTILAGLSVLQIVKNVGTGFPTNNVSVWLGVAAAGVAVIAAVFLFRPDAAAWFGVQPVAGE